jgi:hypothetical protein
MSGGARVWYFPDGYLPQKVADSPMEAHEALMILNTSNSSAQVTLDFYFEDRDPIKGVAIEVGAERIRTLRIDHPEEIGGVAISPLTQYSIRLMSDVPIVAQFGRVDTTQSNLAYYIAPAISEP